MTYIESGFTLSANDYSGNLEIDASVESTGAGRIDFMLFSGNGASGINGYLFKYSAIIGEQVGQIYRLDDGAATSIATYDAPVNSSQLTGVQNMKCLYYALTGLLMLYFNGSLVAQAKDKTYAINGPVGYASEVVQGKIGNNLKITAAAPAQSGVNLLSGQGIPMQIQPGATDGGYVENLTIAAGSYPNTSSTIEVAAGVIRVSDGNGGATGLQNVNLVITPADSGPNGNDGSDPSGITMPYIFAIYDPSTQTTAGLVSAGQTPTLPAGYTQSKLIGCYYQNGSWSLPFPAFVQYGSKFYYSPKSIGYTSVSATSFQGYPSTYISPIAFNVLLGLGMISMPSSGNNSIIVSADGVNHWCSLSSAALQAVQAAEPALIVEMPLPTPQTVWAEKLGNGNGTPGFFVMGFQLNL